MEKDLNRHLANGLPALEQLGSDKAAVRLGGAYALERLAQENAEQRSTVVSVFCAYLRMPFEPPGTLPSPKNVGYETALAKHRERVQEKEVRVAVQRILRDHLRAGTGEQLPVNFWVDTDLDLTGAHLVDFDLVRCTARRARFKSVTFTGPAYFESVTFTGITNFGEATFKYGIPTQVKKFVSSKE